MSNNVQFKLVWEDPGAAQGPELRATWAKLAIWIGGQCVTKNADGKSRALRDSLYLPVYPLAEWLAGNWWVLLGEPVNFRRTRPEQYRRRHSVRSAAEGFALPNLTFMPEGELVHAVWHSRRDSLADLEFVENGSAYIPRAEIEAALKEFIESVVSRLQDQGIKETPLQEEWRSYSALDGEELRFCTAAGKLGRDPFDVSDEEANAIVKAAKSWDETSLSELLAASDPLRVGDTFERIRQVEAKLAEHISRFQRIEAFRQKHRAEIAWERKDPWSIGYHYAKVLRQWLGAPESLVSTRKYDKMLGLSHRTESFARRDTDELFRAIDVLIVHGRNGFAVGTCKHAQNSRFVQYRALFEMLVAGPSSAFAIVSAAHSARQKANRAFAAEFLAPADSLREYFKETPANESSIRDVAGRLGVSELLVSHQLLNHGIVPEDTMYWNVRRYPMAQFTGE